MQHPKVLVIDDNPMALSLMNFHLQEWNYEITTAQTAEEGLQKLQSQQFDIVLTDLQLPGLNGIELIRRGKTLAPETEFLIVTGYPSLAKAMESVRAGAYYLVEKPIDFESLKELLEKALESRAQAIELHQLYKNLSDPSHYCQFLGSSDAMQHIYQLIENAGASEAPALIVGELGTGKEWLANVIHFRSRHAAAPLVKLNCRALPKETLAAELFGYTQGAFSGAITDKAGAMDRATGGSLILDEITAMTPELQEELLHILASHSYHAVGSNQTSQANFRLIALTEHSPSEAISRGALQRNFYERLRPIEIHIPPLRERLADIQPLAEHFMHLFTRKYQRNAMAISPQAVEKLTTYSWPGNMRELQNVIERAVLLSSDKVLQINALAFSAFISESTEAKPITADQEATIKELCQQIIESLPEPQLGAPTGRLFPLLEMFLAQAAVERTRGNKQAAARLLGIYRPRLYNLLKQANVFFRQGSDHNSLSAIAAKSAPLTQ